MKVISPFLSYVFNTCPYSSRYGGICDLTKDNDTCRGKRDYGECGRYKQYRRKK